MPEQFYESQTLTSFRILLHTHQRFFDNRYFHIVFIDASHQYCDVVQDIIRWSPKVKSNGFLTGHDYEADLKEKISEWKTLPLIDPRFHVISNQQHVGVARAVEDCFPEKCAIHGVSCWAVKLL